MRKLVATILAALLFQACGAKRAVDSDSAPVFDKAIAFDMDADADWKVKLTSNAPRGSLVQWVRAEDNAEDWNEQLSQQVLVTDTKLEDHILIFISLLAEYDQEVSAKRERMPDGSVIVEYRSVAAREHEVRRYFDGPDAIYMLSYNVRPEKADPAVLEQWRKIIREAELVDNPALGG